MQNVYITRNGKQIQLTVNEIMAAWVAWDAETRKQQLGTYKEEVKQTLLKLSKENDNLDINDIDDLIAVFIGIGKMFDVANDDDGWTTYSNGFDATYGWESVMMEMFEELAPVLEDGSDLFINCDDGVDVLVIKDGKCIQEK